MATKKAKSSQRMERPRTRKTKQQEVFAFEPYDDLQLQIESLASRIRNADKIAARICAEESPIDPAKYFARLRKKRSQLIKQAERLPGPVGKRKKRSVLFQTGRPLRGGYQIEVAGTVDRPVIDFGSMPRPTTSIVSEGASIQAVGPTTWNVDTDGGSRATMSVDAEFSGQPNELVNFTASLIDDADWYTTDTADSTAVGVEYIWEFPELDHDAVLVVSLESEHVITFTNSADDNASCKSTMTVAWSEPDGEFPDDPFPIFISANPLTSMADSGREGSGLLTFNFWGVRTTKCKSTSRNASCCTPRGRGR